METAGGGQRFKSREYGELTSVKDNLVYFLHSTLEMLDLLLKWELLSDLSKRIARGKGRRWGFDDVSYHPPFVQSGSL